MRIKEEILAELRKGTPFAEIQRKFRSQSQTYEALREFFAEADQTVEEKRERLAAAQAALAEAEADCDKMRMEKEDLSVEVQKLRDAKKNLSGEVEVSSETLAALNADIEELESRGFTSEIVKEIKVIRDRSGPELLSQLKDLEKCKQAKKELAGYKMRKARLKREVIELTTESRRLREQVVSEKNKLDEARMRVVTVSDAVAVVEDLFSDGYSSDDIASLKHGLDTLGIKGDPLLSIARLVEGLSKVKSLVVLNESLSTSKAALSSLQKELANTKGELKAIGHVALKAVEEAKDQGVKAINSIAANVDTATADAAVRLDQLLARFLDDVDVGVRQIMAGVQAELSEWSEIQQQKGKLGRLFRPGLALLGILESPEVLETIELPLVVQLLERLAIWCEWKLPSASISPSQDIFKKEFTLNPMSSYNVSALIEFVHYGLKRLMIQRQRAGEQ